MAIRVTQLGNEVWVINPSKIRVTQVGTEVWMIPTGGKIRVTQLGIETWRSVADEPLTIEGHADGVARPFAYTSFAYTTEGHADGYATAQETSGLKGSAIMVVMGI
jgi:hypothetical protein